MTDKVIDLESRRPGYSMARIRAALEGRFDAAQLSESEAVIFDDLLGEVLGQVTTQEERDFFKKLRQEGGGIGYDDQDRLVRGLPGGGVEVIDASLSPDESTWIAAGMDTLRRLAIDENVRADIGKKIS